MKNWICETNFLKCNYNTNQMICYLIWIIIFSFNWLCIVHTIKFHILWNGKRVKFIPIKLSIERIMFNLIENER